MEMKLSENESSTHSRKIVIASSLLVVAIATFLYNGGFGGGLGLNSSSDGAKANFTADEGKTWFADSSSLVPPFQYHGKMAVQVVLFSDDGGKTPFAGYLQRYDAVTKKQLDANPKAPRTLMAGAEVKKPGAPETAWVARNTVAGINVTTKIVSPKGSTNVAPYEP